MPGGKRVFAGVASAMAGALVPLQAAINAMLAHKLHTLLGAAAVSLLCNYVILYTCLRIRAAT